MNLQSSETLAELTQCFNRLLKMVPCLNNEEEYQIALKAAEILLVAAGRSFHWR